MSAFFQWFASAEWVQVVTALLHSLWQGAAIALLLALFLRRITNPIVRYRISLAALVGVVLAGMLTWAVLNTSERVRPLLLANQPLAQSQSVPSGTQPLSDNADRIIVTAQLTPAAPTFHWTAALAFVWLLGAGLMLVRTSVKIAGAGRLRRSCRPLEDIHIERLVAEARLAIGLFRQVRIGVTDRLTSPAVVGVFVPMLILPLSLLSTLSPEQIRFVLLHELAHIRRGDYLANLLQFFVESLLFFNPAVWWISHQVRREREACCDALATALSGAPADYARTLVHVAENVLQQSPSAAPAFGGQRDSSSLLERIHRLLVPGYRPSLRLTWRAMLAGLTLGSALLILSAVGTRTTVAAILTPDKSVADSWPDPHFTGYENIKLQPQFLMADKSRLSAILPGLVSDTPVAIPSGELADFQRKLEMAGALTYNQAQPLGFTVISGGNFHVQVGGCTNSTVCFNIEQRGARSVVVGAEVQFCATQTEWSRMDFFWTPWKERGTIRSEMKLALNGNTNGASPAKITIPANGGMAWAMESTPGNCQIVLLRPPLADKAVASVPEAANQINLQRAVQTNEVSLVGMVLAPVEPIELNRQTNYAPAESYSPKLAEDNSSANTSNLLSERLQEASNQVNLTGTTKTIRSNSSNHIKEKLEAIHLSNVSFDNVPLGEVIKDLYKDSKRLDPDKTGINFIADDEITNALVMLPAGPADSSMEKVLDDVVNGSAMPIHYSIQDHGVVFQPGKAGDQLQVRWFKVDPNVLANHLEVKLDPGTTNLNPVIPAKLREAFQKAGVDLDVEKHKSFFYNDRAGVLIVRATASELDKIEAVVGKLNYTSPLVNVKTEFIGISDESLWRLMRGFNITNHLAAGGFSAVLDSGSTKEFWRICNQDHTANILTAPEVTTIVDRQAEVQVVDIRTICEGIKPEATVFPGIISTNFADIYKVKNAMLGTIVDVIPHMGSEDDSMRLTAIPSLTEFMGYEKSDDSVPVYFNGTRQSQPIPVPHPLYRIRSVAADVTLLQGQTLVLCGAPWKEIHTSPGEVYLANGKETFPRSDLAALTNLVVWTSGKKILSDEPFGKPRAKLIKDDGHQMIVLITATFIDPAGNRIDMPKRAAVDGQNNLSASAR